MAGADVLIIDKAARDWRGRGMMSGGNMIVMQPGSNSFTPYNSLFHVEMNGGNSGHPGCLLDNF